MRAERGHFRDMKKRDLMTDTLTEEWQLHTRNIHIESENSPFNMGHNWPTSVIPPAPRYCPIATSWKKIGIPHSTIAIP